MAEYNGTIELISGITPKNNGTFPLVNAKDVAFYENGEEIRLTDKINQVGISDEEKENLIKDAVREAENALSDDIDSLNTKIRSNSGSINILTSQVAELQQQINNGDNPNLRISYEPKENRLYLYEDPENNGLIKPDPEQGIIGNVISSTEIIGGGGTGASLPYKLTLKKLSDIKTALKNDVVNIEFNANMVKLPSASEEGEPMPIDKNLTFRLNSKTETMGILTTTFKRETNKNESFDITPYLGTGRNEITLTVSYTEEIVVEGEIIPITITSSQPWTIKIIEFYVSSEFNDSTPFINQNVSWPGFAYGDINKTIHYELNGNPWKTVSNLTSKEDDISINIPFQGHKTSRFTVYATAEIENEDGSSATFTSNKLEYELLFIDANNTAPVLKLKATPSPMQQYTAGTFNFTVYSNVETVKEVVLKEGLDNVIFDGEVNNAMQSISYTFMDFGNKTIVLSYTYNDIEYTKSIELLVEKSTYQINPVTGGLVLDFSPIGRSNSASDYNVFYNYAEELVEPDVAATLPKITWEFSDNFDWNNGGWQVDKDNNTYFCVKAGTQVKINYDMFQSSTIIKNGKDAGTGREFKLIFKTTNVSQPNATFLSCLNEQNVGLQMNVHEAYINSNGSQIYSPYSEEDIIEFDFNIFPGIDSGQEMLPVGDIIPMTMTYEDGTPFQPLVHSQSTSYEHKTFKPIIIGSSDCDVHIYRMKIYNNYLTDKQVLANFIADARDGAEKVARYTRNLIYDANNLTPNSLAEACPDLKIIKITCPKFTNSKSDFQPMTSVEMIHKNGDPYKDNWKFEDCFIVGQGTTSNNYRDAGKNLELICCFDGEYVNKKILKEYYGNDKDKYYQHRTKLTLNPNDDNIANRIDNSYDATIENSPGDGKVALHENYYPNNYFNVKVNIASSDNANNALQANRYQRYMPYATPAQKRDSRIKTTMDFVNCVVFLCETDPSGIEFPPNKVITQPADSDYHFYALGNIGDSKKTDSGRAYTIDDEKEFVVEIMDNDKPNAAFPTGFKTENNEFIYPISKEDWEATDGYKKVEESFYLIDENLPIFYELIDGQYIKTSDETINPSKTYYEVNYLNPAYASLYINKFRYVEGKDPVQDSGWLASYEMRYGEDSEENIAIWNEFYEWLILSSNNEFKSQFSNWFIQNAALYYFLYTERYTMMDNRAKNSFWHWAKFYITEEEAEQLGEKAKYYTIDNAAAAIHDGYRFDFWDYDNDTALGIDNNGTIKFPYGLEDIDKNADSTFVFNAGNSVFFRRIRDNFTSELSTVYGTTTQADTWDPAVLIEEYDKWQSEFPEALWLEDTERKYYRTYRSKVLNLPSLTQDWLTAHLTARMQGRKKYHRRQWERDQADYMDSKYGTSRAQNKGLLLRCKTPPNAVVKADYTWHLQPYKKMYLRAYRGEILQDSIRALDLNKTYDLIGSTTSLEDAQLRVYSANCIQDFGDISPFYAYSVEVGSGTEKAKRLIIGNETPGYSNDNLTNIEVGTAKILKTLNIQNLKKIASVALVPSLQYLYAQGSGLTNATFAKGGAIIEAYLPSTVNTIIADDLYYLEKIELDSYDNLQTLLIDKCPKLTKNGYDLQLVENAINSLQTVRLTDVNWTLNSTQILNKFVTCSGFEDDNITNKTTSSLTGTIIINSAVRQAELDKYQEVWGAVYKQKDDPTELTGDLVIIYQNLMPQWKVRYEVHNQIDGSLLSFYEELVDNNTNLNNKADYIEPIERGVMEIPKHPFNEGDQYKYIYKNWQTLDGIVLDGKPSSRPIIVTKDIVLQAKFDKEIAYYTVEWMSDDTDKAEVIAKMQTVVNGVTYDGVPWGTDVSYEKAVKLKDAPTTKEPDGFNYYVFKGWDTPTTVVKKNMVIKPQWAHSTNQMPDVETEKVTPEQLYALKASGTIKNLFPLDKDGVTPKEYQQITVQLGYMPDFKNIESKVLAENYKLENGVLETGLFLFDTDKSFTLAIDFENEPSKTVTQINPHIVSCVYSNSNLGIENQGFYVEATPTTKPKLTYLQNVQTVGFSNRDIFVIRKIKGDPGLYVYTNNRYSSNPVQTNYLEHSVPFTTNIELIFGGRKTSAGNYVSNNFCEFGTIKYAKIWFDDLGEDECKNICSWIYDTMQFENVGANRYALGEETSQITFVATELLEEKFSKYTAAKPTKFDNSLMRSWLREKMFKGFNLTWQNVISKVRVNTLDGPPNSEGKVTGTSDYLYIPAYTDVIGPRGAAETNLRKETLATKGFSTFTDEDSRIKKVFNTNETMGYWLRTPNYNSGIEYYQYGVNSAGTILSKCRNGAGLSQAPDIDLGILLCFSL